MRPPKKNYVIKAICVTITLALFHCASNAQVNEDCTYGKRLSSINHFLDSSIAQEWITHYLAYTDSVQKGMVKPTAVLFADSTESFNRHLIQQILDVPGCIGERVFLGINDKQKIVVILGGVDSCGRTLYITDDGAGNKMQKGGQMGVGLFKSKLGGGGGGLGEFGQNP